MALLGFSIVLLHLLVGFGFMMYKLLPKDEKVTLKKNNPEKATNESKKV